MKILMLPLLLVAVTLGTQATPQQSVRSSTIYVDCGADERGNGSGSLEQPVTSLQTLNTLHFAPGTHILFKRGSQCRGSFVPRAGNSGLPGAPIVVAAYGDKTKGRPVIAAGCQVSRTDPDQSLTAAGRTLRGISPYHSLCQGEDGVPARAAIYLYNVEQWEISQLELTNDGQQEGARTGLLVQLEDFGTGHHYRVNDVYVHHVRGMLKDQPASLHTYKETGGILFNITRQGEVVGRKQRRTAFEDVLVENNEVFHVDGIGLSNRSAWMCRDGGAPCGDYPPYKNHPYYLNAPSAAASDDFTPSIGMVFRHNLIHDIGGDGIIVRTATQPLVESNLVYDVWMRARGNSAGVWVINTDGALVRYNEVHHVRYQEPWEPGDGMAFDADMGARDTHFQFNFSHDNEGGMMLFCGCGMDGLGHPAQSVKTLVEDNLSLNDGRRVLTFAGSQSAVVRHNIVLNTMPGLVTPVLENTGMGSRNAGEIRENQFYAGAGQGQLFRKANSEFRHDDIRWSGNRFYGYGAAVDFGIPLFFAGDVPNQRLSVDAADPDTLIRDWMQASDFAVLRYRR